MGKTEEVSCGDTMTRLEGEGVRPLESTLSVHLVHPPMNFLTMPLLARHAFLSKVIPKALTSRQHSNPTRCPLSPGGGYPVLGGRSAGLLPARGGEGWTACLRKLVAHPQRRLVLVELVSTESADGLAAARVRLPQPAVNISWLGLPLVVAHYAWSMPGWISR